LRKKTVSVAFQTSGARGALAHLCARYIGDNRFLRPASSIDFRKSQIEASVDLVSFISSLSLNFSELEIKEKLSRAQAGLQQFTIQRPAQLPYPNSWNSGQYLQLLLASLVLLMRPKVVVETGTANGASTLAIAFALAENNSGKLWSFDIESNVGALIPKELKQFVNFRKISGTPESLHDELLKIKIDSNPSIF